MQRGKNAKLETWQKAVLNSSNGHDCINIATKAAENRNIRRSWRTAFPWQLCYLKIYNDAFEFVQLCTVKWGYFERKRKKLKEKEIVGFYCKIFEN